MVCWPCPGAQAQEWERILGRSSSRSKSVPVVGGPISGAGCSPTLQTWPRTAPSEEAERTHQGARSGESPREAHVDAGRDEAAADIEEDEPISGEAETYKARRRCPPVPRPNNQLPKGREVWELEKDAQRMFAGPALPDAMPELMRGMELALHANRDPYQALAILGKM